MPYDQPGSSSPTTKWKVKVNPLLAKWLGWGLAGLAALVLIWGIWIIFHDAETGNTGLLGSFSDLLFFIFPVIFSVLAALIISRQPGNLIGWLMTVPALGGILTNLSGGYLRNFTAPPPGPSFFFLFTVWVNSTSWVLFIYPIVLIPLFFPDGRPPSRRWNWVTYYAAFILLTFYVMTTASTEITPNDVNWSVTNPIGLVSGAEIDRLFLLPWVIGLISLPLLCVSALIVRYRRGTSVEKAQIKWVVYASLFFGVIFLLGWPASQSDNSVLFNLFFVVFAFSLSVVPLSISIAILRYRLWDIDFVINRSYVYGALTILLALIFGGSLFLASLLVEGQNFVLAFGMTALVAGISFNPTRRRIQRFVDQRFYNIQIDYQKTLPFSPPANATQVLRETHFGMYQNLELIGRGGMAEVYKSTHPTLGTPVAIKILPAQLAADEEYRKRFVREAQTLSKLDHPNIVRIFDSGEQGGIYYMVMEYLPGRDLGQLIKANGKLSVAEARPLIQQIAFALEYAHSKGYVHRDIKPSNVLLDMSSDTTRAVLTDFGIAKIFDAHTAMTRTGYMLGTFDYIAPEQIQESSTVDGRADIYSLGVMVYQLLTGEPPFKQVHPGALLIAHLNQPPPDPRSIVPDLPARVAEAIQRAMAKKPEERFGTTLEFFLEIEWKDAPN